MDKGYNLHYTTVITVDTHWYSRPIINLFMRIFKPKVVVKDITLDFGENGEIALERIGIEADGGFVVTSLEGPKEAAAA